MKQKKKISIKTKLLGTILPIVAVIVLVISMVSYLISKSIITEYSQNLLSTSIENQTNEMEAWLDENLSAFQIVKQTIEGAHPDGETLQNILDSYYNYNSNYSEGLYIADEDGTLTKALKSNKTEKNPTESVWYKDGITRLNMGFTQAYTNATGEEVVSASGILNDGSDKLKVISVDLSLQKMSIIVNSSIEMEGAEAFLVDLEDGTILAHRDNSLISTKLSASDDAFLKLVNDKISSYDYSMTELNNNMTAFNKVSGTDWMLVSYIPTDIVYADIEGVRTMMIIMGLVSLILLAVLTERVVHTLIRPVSELTNVITSMTSGDFTVDVRTSGNDEIGIMGRCVAGFVEAMRSMISSIGEVSNKLHVQADNSNGVAQQMYDASKLQSQSMNELNSTVEQLSVSVNEIADNATTLAMVVSDTKNDGSKVNEKVQETVEISHQSKADMQNVESAMNNINDSIAKLTQAIDKVGDASEEITNITDVISNIAEETNLLSLNASIEAARAGEAGRGFAVVASQIGKLALNSSESVQNIEKLILDIKLLVKDAVLQAEDSAKHINSSNVLVEDTLQNFDTIFNNIDEVNTLVQQMLSKVSQVDEVATNVAAISEEQAASAEEILATSDTMVEQANSITSNSQVVADDAAKLTTSSQELADHVSKFKVEKNQIETDENVGIRIKKGV